MKKCKNCQSVYQDDVKYCAKCGANEFIYLQTDQASVQTNKRANKKVLGLVALLIVLAVSTIVIYKTVNNPTESLIMCFEEEDYSAAKEIYREKIYGNSKREEKTFQEVYEYVAMQEEQFENKEVAYDVVIKRLETIKSIGIIDNSINNTIDNVAKLHDARIYYERAEKAYEEKDYVTAIDYYSRASQYEFESTEEATEKLITVTGLYRDEMLLEAQKCVEEHSFQSAALILDEALSVLSDDTELLLAKEECAKAEYDYSIQLMIEEADVFVSNNDYIGALQCIDVHIGSYPAEAKLQQTREQYLKQFENYIISKSLELAQSGDYKQAVSLAESGLNYFMSNQVTELLTIYNSHIPVQLGDMDIFLNNTQGGSWQTKTTEKDAYSKDNYGNQYTHSFSAGCGTVEYLVNFNYQTFSGTVAFPNGLDSDSFRESASLYIYGDGQLLASFKEVSETSRPESFSIDIASYEKIALKWVTSGLNIWRDWGYFATIFDGVFMPIALELPAI